MNGCHLHTGRTEEGDLMNDPIVDEVRSIRAAHAAQVIPETVRSIRSSVLVLME